MTRNDPYTARIPWYANGTLEPADRAEVEEHLAGCAECRALLDAAREQMTRATADDHAAMLRHVHPRLLVAYAEAPERLEEETSRWIEERLERCEVCRDAYRLLLQVEESLARAETPAVASPSTLARVWEFMSGTLLRPAPALAYLLLLALVVPFVWRDGADDGFDVPPLSAPTVISVEGDRATRAPGGGAPAPLSIALTRGIALLELKTELRPEDLADPGLDYAVELLRDGERLWSERRRAAELVPRDGRVLVPVVLDLGRLVPGTPYEVVLRARKPGDPLDGQPLFRRTIEIRGDPGGESGPP